MELFLSIANVLKAYIFDNPAFLMGIVACVGLLVQKRHTEEVIIGTVKAIAGFMIMSTGASMIGGTVFPISYLLEKIIGLNVTTTAMGQAAFTEKYGSVITIIMVGAFIVNILLARFTRFKYIYLTVHEIFWMTFVYTAVVIEVHPNISSATLIIAGSILGGLYFTLQPAITQPFVRKVTGNDNIAYGHTTSFGAIAGSLAGNLFKKDKDKSSEQINIPKKLSFLKDITVSTALIMVIMYVVCVAIAGPAFVEKNLSGGKGAFIYAISQGLAFSIDITILMMGVNMMMAEIIPAFKGFSEKLVPNAIPALDCPVIFNFAPTAVMIGFLSCLSTVLVCVVLFGAVGFYALTPPVVTTFFGGGPAGVFGNSTGGWKGAIAGGVVAGLLMSFGQALTVPALSHTIADFARWASDSDFSVFPVFFKMIVSLF